MLLWTPKGWDVTDIAGALWDPRLPLSANEIARVVQSVTDAMPFPTTAVVRFRGNPKRYVVTNVETSGRVGLAALSGGMMTPSNVDPRKLDADVNQRVFFEGANARKLQTHYEYLLEAHGNSHLKDNLPRKVTISEEKKAKDLARVQRVETTLDAPVSAARLRAAAIQLEPQATRELKAGSSEYEKTKRRQATYRAMAKAVDAGTALPWSIIREIDVALWKTPEMFREFENQAVSIPSVAEAQRRARLQQLVDELGDIPGYFPTPQEVITKVMDEAALQRGDLVLEPSAGKGNLAIVARSYGTTVDVFEVNYRLNEILKLQNFNVLGFDFMEAPVNPVYDVVVMNPPFEKGQDAEHVQRAFEWLKPGGRLVAVMSEGPFFRQDKKSTAFRSWMDAHGGISYSQEDAFKHAERKTGVRTRVIVVDKA